MVSRRGFIRVAGGAAVVAAVGAGAFLSTRTPSRALQPWYEAGTAETEPRRRALSYAILAPNPHNRQPWMVRLEGDDELVLYCDPERDLPETDPFSRQIVIGLGCFIELLGLAAAAGGHKLVTTPFPDGFSDEIIDDRPVAHIRFVPDSVIVGDPIFAAVLDRRSNKEPFDIEKPVSADALARMRAAADAVDGVSAHGTLDPQMIDALRQLTWEAFETEALTPATYLESVRLMRIGKAEIEASPDGIDLGGPFLESLKLMGMLSREQLADPASTAFAQGLDMYREITQTAMGYLWLTTPSNTRLDQLAAGAAYLRFNLMASSIGVDVHPLSQALQEYDEMKPHFDAVTALLASPAPERIQMLARLGHGPEIAPSPRWPVEAKIETA